MKQPLRRRLMLVLASFTLGVSALFGLLAMAYVYAVEDRFLDRLLQAEAQRQRAHFASHGQWLAPVGEGIRLHASLGSLPADLRDTIAAEPRRREASGQQGRHYHLLALQQPGTPPWLVAEVSQQLIVRPMRNELLAWLLGGGLALAALSLLVAHGLSRRISAPLEGLAARLQQGQPGELPQQLAVGQHDDEIGALARAFDRLLERTRAFIDREQAFTRDASHELRTPLAVLRLAIERLQADPGLPPPARQQLAPMLAATQLMEQAVHTLLLLAREGEAGRKQALPALPTPLLPLVEQWVLAHAGWLDDSRQTLDLGALSRQSALALPPAVLQLALSSLLANAVAHGTPGGCIELRLAEGGLQVRNPSPPLASGVEAPAGSPAGLPAKGSTSTGFGFGLAIVQRLLQAHGSGLAVGHEAGFTWACIADPSARS